jgi:hypothetical protein
MNINKPRLDAVVPARRQIGAAYLLIIIAVALVLAAFLVVGLQLNAGPAGPVTFTVYSGSMTAPQPMPLVDQSVGVTYKVTTHTVTVPYGGGPGFPPTAQTPKVALKDAVVAFSLANGDATFADGSTVKSITTGANGLANVAIVPSQDGDDTLSFVMSITTGSLWWKKTHTIPDSVAVQFEVEAP